MNLTAEQCAVDACTDPGAAVVEVYREVGPGLMDPSGDWRWHCHEHALASLLGDRLLIDGLPA